MSTASVSLFVGHHAYRGDNALRVHTSTHGAVIDLVRRGVDGRVARQVIEEVAASPWGWRVISFGAARSRLVEVSRRD
jgi:hypothetical protein